MGEQAVVEESRTIRVLVVDDHQILSASLAHALSGQPDIEVVAQAPDLESARREMALTKPDVVLLDYRLPDGDGVSALPELRALHPSAAFVVLTASASEHVLIRAIQAGAAGFLSKTRGLPELTAAVRAAAGGESVISPEMLARLLPRLRRGAAEQSEELTSRELEVLHLLGQGLSNAAIAERLTVSVHTVRNHVANVSSKLGAHSKLEVLAIAVRDGLLAE